MSVFLLMQTNEWVSNYFYVLHCKVGLNGGNSITLNSKFFWLCINFQHVNSNSKKFTVTVIFFQKGTKWSPKRPTDTPIYYVKYIKEFWAFSNNFRLFQDFRRLLKTDEDVRRLTKMSEDVRRYPRRNAKN